jgi:putative tricarboxylic transport membrane protein
MKRIDLVTAIMLLGVSLGGLMQARELPLGNLMVPGSGFFPLILSILLGILSLILLGQALIENSNGESVTWGSSKGRRKTILTLGVILLITVLFEYLGYLLATFLLVGFLIWMAGNLKLWLATVISLICVLGIYLLFGIILKTPLPTGIVGHLVGW